MSSTVKVDTDLSLMDYGILAGIMAIISAALYLMGFKIKNLATVIAILILAILGLLLWGLLTDHMKVSNFVAKHQMLSIIAAGAVSGTMLVSLFSIGSVKFMHS